MPTASVVLLVTHAQRTSGGLSRCQRFSTMAAHMPSRYAVYVLGLMVGINLLHYMDRWVGSGVAPLIHVEFGLSDCSVGLLGSAFTLVYALAALPFGLWADRGSRTVGPGGRVPALS